MGKTFVADFFLFRELEYIVHHLCTPRLELEVAPSVK